MTTVILTLAAMVAFAANSIITRMALAGGHLDAATFTAVRLASGAAMLGLLAGRRLKGSSGGWISGLALFAYAAPFSFAYVRIGAAVGALILFGAVQLSMIAWGLWKGERPAPLTWLGLAVATGGLVALMLPGVTRPDLAGASLMALAGVAWGVYSLRGKGSPDPVAANARNFIWSAVPALGLAAVLLRPDAVTGRGLLLAAMSGAVTSGLGYAIWYRALRGLGAVQAAGVQLSVPVIAALGAVAFLGEPVSLRLGLAGGAVLGGVALVIAARSTPRRSG